MRYRPVYFLSLLSLLLFPFPPIVLGAVNSLDAISQSEHLVCREVPPVREEEGSLEVEVDQSRHVSAGWIPPTRLFGPYFFRDGRTV